MVFRQNLLEKTSFIAKMSGPTMVRPASSDFWKVPLEAQISKFYQGACPWMDPPSILHFRCLQISPVEQVFSFSSYSKAFVTYLKPYLKP